MAIRLFVEFEVGRIEFPNVDEQREEARMEKSEKAWRMRQKFTVDGEHGNWNHFQRQNKRKKKFFFGRSFFVRSDYNKAHLRQHNKTATTTVSSEPKK